MRLSKTSNKRVLKKKRSKADGNSEKNSATAKKRFATKKKSSTTNSAVRHAPLQQKMTVLRKKQAQERMVLKEHLKDLQRKKLSRTRGEDAKNERRQMGKYIKQLKKQQVNKHADEINNVTNQEAQNALQSGNYQELRTRNLSSINQVHRKKAQRYLQAPLTVGLPHGRSSANPVPIPSNVSNNVNFLAQMKNSSNYNNNNNNGNNNQQQQQARRWQNNNSNNDFNGDEWIDVDEDGAIPSSNQQQQRNGNGNNNNNNSNDQLRQLFSGFGVK